MSHKTFGPEVTQTMLQELARSMGAESVEYVGHDDAGDPVYALEQLCEPDRQEPRWAWRDGLPLYNVVTPSVRLWCALSDELGLRTADYLYEENRDDPDVGKWPPAL